MSHLNFLGLVVACVPHSLWYRTNEDRSVSKPRINPSTEQAQHTQELTPCVKFRVLEGEFRPCSHGSLIFLAGDYFRQDSASMEKRKQAKVLPGITLCQILALVIFRAEFKSAKAQLLAKAKGVD